MATFLKMRNTMVTVKENIEYYQKKRLEGLEGGEDRGIHTWGRDILKWTNKSYEECVRLAGERSEWRAMVADLLREMAQT